MILAHTPSASGSLFCMVLDPRESTVNHVCVIIFFISNVGFELHQLLWCIQKPFSKIPGSVRAVPAQSRLTYDIRRCVDS